MNATDSRRRIRVLRSYNAIHSYRASLDFGGIPVAWIDRQTDIPRPYSYGPVDALYLDQDGRYVLIAETGHRRWEVWQWTGTVYCCEADAEAVAKINRLGS